MTYLYLIYDKKDEEIVKTFTPYLDYINYKNFPYDENCHLNFNEVDIDFFISKELKYGVSNRIYRINSNKIYFIDTDEVEEKHETKSGKIFYESFNFDMIRLEILHYFRVEEEDYESYILMIEKKGCRLSRNLNMEYILGIFIKSGNFHRYLRIVDKITSGDLAVFREFSSKGEYYKSKNPDVLFQMLSENKSTHRIEIALYFIDFSTSEENLRKFKDMNPTVTPHVQFFDDHVQLETLTADEIIGIAMNLHYGKIFRCLLEIAVNKGQEIGPVDEHFLFFEGYNNHYSAPVKLFEMTFARKLRKETRFSVFARLFMQLKPNFRNALADVLLDIIEFNIEGFNKPDTLTVIKLIPDEDRKYRFIDFMRFNSKESDDPEERKFLEYARSFKGNFFHYYIVNYVS